MLKKLLILILIPFLLCSCSRNNIEEISFASWGSATETKILHSLISEFEKNNPDIKVNFIHVPQNYFQKLHLLFASNQAPDVVFINNLYLPLYAKKLEPLDNFLDKNDFYPQSIQAMSYDSHLYAIPRDISNLVFYYNKSLIKQNLNPDWNFSDFEKLLQKKYCKNCYATSFEPDVFIASPYITTLGYEKGINLYKNLEGRCAPNPAQVGSSTLAQMFIEGRITFYLSGRNGNIRVRHIDLQKYIFRVIPCIFDLRVFFYGFIRSYYFSGDCSCRFIRLGYFKRQQTQRFS